MKNLIRPSLSALALAFTLLAAACGGGAGPEPEAPGAPAGGETQAAALDTTCQVALPPTGEGSAEGMTDDPVATAASNNPALSTLVKAVGEAGLVDTLNGLQGATVFAPSNDAFAKIPEADLNAVLADKEQLTKILTLHVVPEQKLDAQALASRESVPTVNGEQITLAVEDRSLMVNGQADVICPNVKTANATVHIIDTVMMPKS
ncbi:MAG: fasciclin domain-containing protein [Egibacteraceae bacterium]